VIERLAASRAAPQGDARARIHQVVLGAGVSAVTLCIFLVDFYGGAATVDASLYVIPIVMTLWLRAAASTILFTLIAILLGTVASLSRKTRARRRRGASGGIWPMRHPC
jgi:hypothetical protein